MKKTPFPDGFWGVELFYDDDWQDVGTDLDRSGFRVSHGADSLSDRAAASSLEFRVTNAEGKYSPRHPTSPLYGLVGRNTPARSVVALGAPWLDLSAPGARAEGDATANTTVGLDLRWWGHRDDWSLRGDLLSKYGPAGERAFMFRTEPFTNGNLPTLYWSEDGTATWWAQSFVGVPDWAGEIALRAVLVVSTGTVTFFYGTSLDGPWVQMGPALSIETVTNVHESAAPVTLGRNLNGSGIDVPQKCYGFQVRDTLSGTVLSGADFATDTLPSWTFTDAPITNRHIVASCEVAEWPVDWNRKGSPSVMTSVTASGPSRRLGQGAQALDSVLYRTISGMDTLTGYWPMEDGRDASELGAAVGSTPATFEGNATPAAYDSFPGSAPIVGMSGPATIVAQVDDTTDVGAVQVRWVQFTPTDALPVSEVTIGRVWLSGGSISRVDFRMRDSDGALGIFAFDEDGGEISGSTFFGGSSIRDSSRRMSVEVLQDGSDVIARYVHLAPGAPSGTVGDVTFPGRTVGRASRVILRGTSGFALGHLTVEHVISSIFDIFGGPLVGYRGELAGDRVARLAEENGVAAVIRGDSAPVGEQDEEKLLDLMSEATAADGGMLHDDASSIALRFRGHASLYSQPAVVIPYDDNRVIPFRPVDDDRLSRNRVTVARKNGSRFTHERENGPMSLQPPPDGIGLYDTSLTLNVDTDRQADRASAWLLHVGTWDVARYPTLGVDLANPFFLADPVLTRELLAISPGDRLLVEDPPPWLPPFAVDVLVVGVRIEVQPLHVLLRWSCIPAGPYRVAYWSAGHRWSGSGTALAGALDSTSTTFAVDTPGDLAWTSDDGQYDIDVGGEIMTVTDVTGDTMTVVRSVNGVVKAHAADAAVALAEPSFYAR